MPQFAIVEFEDKAVAVIFDPWFVGYNKKGKEKDLQILLQGITLPEAPHSATGARPPQQKPEALIVGEGALFDFPDTTGMAKLKVRRPRTSTCTSAPPILPRPQQVPVPLIRQTILPRPQQIRTRFPLVVPQPPMAMIPVPRFPLVVPQPPMAMIPVPRFPIVVPQPPMAMIPVPRFPIVVPQPPMAMIPVPRFPLVVPQPPMGMIPVRPDDKETPTPKYRRTVVVKCPKCREERTAPVHQQYMGFRYCGNTDPLAFSDWREQLKEKGVARKERKK